MERKKVATAGAGVLLAGAAITELTVADFIGFSKFAEIGPWALLIALVAFNIYGMYVGWVVPKPYYDSALARATAAEAAIDRLSDRANKLTDTNAVQASAIEKISAGADTTIKIMSALQDARTNAIKEGAE